ncbi:MAG: VOC family protein [Myxococcota bacterium]
MDSIAFGYTILFVESVPNTLAFFERAFGLATRFLHPAGDYGELQTGATRLAFTSHELASTAVPFDYHASSPSAPLGMEITLTTRDVDGAFARALQAGATKLSDPVDKPWGQRVAYVMTPNGIGVGLTSPLT